ncbi:hypothetical protein [Maridesulfovibrio zosterae]|uniref:hypothetical protein n=1 Tax=Maridesulfovibrio zosterae TaxID=82171 RepID=UPI0004023C2B|nr:hypothetical protein [Maridesulfovibrio zosterae]
MADFQNYKFTGLESTGLMKTNINSSNKSRKSKKSFITSPLSLARSSEGRFIGMLNPAVE